MNFRIFFLILLACALAPAQDCRPGTVGYDVDMRCACVKDPASQTCDLYKRNQSMYDGKGIQMWTPPQGLAAGVQPGNSVTSVTSAPAVSQPRTPHSPTLLAADTPFWRILPPGTKMAVGMRPQQMANSP